MTIKANQDVLKPNEDSRRKTKNIGHRWVSERLWNKTKGEANQISRKIKYRSNVNQSWQPPQSPRSKTIV